LAYLTQKQLTIPLKYPSLYEAQVPGTADSPAHRIEHLKSALKFLQERHSIDLSNLGDVHLMSLLESGIPIDLPEGKQLVLGTLSPNSSYVGKSMKENRLINDDLDWEIVAIFRDEHLIIPHQNTGLEAEDQLLVLTGAEMKEEIQKHFAPK
ncbi:MAG: TrkA C-terminal domain-containing protein, partial [Calditrichota bacterium]